MSNPCPPPVAGVGGVQAMATTTHGVGGLPVQLALVGTCTLAGLVVQSLIALGPEAAVQRLPLVVLVPSSLVAFAATAVDLLLLGS